MQIDVIIATYNRASLLERSVRSILAAPRDPRFDFIITIVDNRSNDETPHVIAHFAETARGRVRGLYEPRPGKSYAVNTGIVAATGDALAFADDDQIMSPDWLPAIYRTLQEGFDFVSGPVHGEWQSPPPAWYDDRLHGVLSLFDAGREKFSQETGDAFSGGNVAVRRAAIDRVGGFHPALGKIAGTFSMCEDGELLLRLKEAGFRGAYDPAMSVSHAVPYERLSKQYFRRWHRGYGRSMASVDALHPQPVRYWLGVPRFLIGRALTAPVRMLSARWRGDLPGVFEQELHIWFLLGFIQGKLTMKPLDPAPGFQFQ